MGKKAKEHRKKVEKRNKQLKQEKLKFEREYQKMITEKRAELEKKFNQVVQEGIEEKRAELEKQELEQTTQEEN